MNKYIIQSFIILIIILLGISLVCESNDKLKTDSEIIDFEEEISDDSEVENGFLSEVNVVREDSSNLISDINAKMASIVVEGLNFVFNLGIKLIEGITN
jgi:cell division protein FtsL